MSGRCDLCPEMSVWTCSCKAPRINLCDSHIRDHLTDQSVPSHPIVRNAIVINENSKKILIKTFKDIKNQANEHITRIMQETASLINIIERCCVSHIRYLNDIIGKSDLLLQQVSAANSSSKAIIPGRILSILTRREQEAIEECSSWILGKLNINNNPIKLGLQELFSIEDSVRLLDVLLLADKESNTFGPEIEFFKISPQKKCVDSNYPSVSIKENFREEIKETQSKASPQKQVFDSSYPNVSAKESFREESKTSPAKKCADGNYPRVSTKENFREEAKGIQRAASLVEQSPKPAETQNIPQRSKTIITPNENNKVLKCAKGHNLSWNNNTPFNYFANSGSFYISCDQCGKTYSYASWNCRECHYDVCRECSLSMGVPLPILSCSSGHELEWKSDVKMHYTNLGKADPSCARCKGNVEVAHWHCRACLYDICNNCAERAGYTSVATSAKCKNKHQLELNLAVLLLGLPVSCDMCKQFFKGETYTCNPCKYFLCQVCYLFLQLPAPGHPIIRCPDKHLLRWFIKGNFICDGCCQRKLEERFRCIECNFDLCSLCSSQLYDAATKRPIKKCRNGHELSWDYQTSKRYGGNAYSCGVCRGEIKRIGSFYCQECSYSCCFRCVFRS
ncbi:unnamed protein product [Blepharisma stoltei]|uniref:Uncharacterized protein n=1 Tax=Blepharisma stoltei TaxID=1481888 RepID=A0AAU9J9B7_9CILI|nr:unnamed protein product [Blepharisma stoltei]